LPGQEHARQQALDFGGAGITEDFRVEVDITIVERSDLQFAQGHAVVAGNLCLDRRGFGTGRGGRDEADAKGDGNGGEAATDHG
jgi:hypothetical protein